MRCLDVRLHLASGHLSIANPAVPLQGVEGLNVRLSGAVRIHNSKNHDADACRNQTGKHGQKWDRREEHDGNPGPQDQEEDKERETAECPTAVLSPFSFQIEVLRMERKRAQ